MSILGAVIAPHPPLIIPAVGRGQERKVQATIDAYRTAAKQTAAWEPEVLIVTSPHQIMYADYFHISPGKGASGDMSTWNGKLAEFGPLVPSSPPVSDRRAFCGWRLIHALYTLERMLCSLANSLAKDFEGA